MAKANSTRSTSTTAAPKGEVNPPLPADLNSDEVVEIKNPFSLMAIKLNRYGGPLAGIEQICRCEDIGGDALNVAAVTCRDINENLCRMADRLDAMATEGGAA